MKTKLRFFSILIFAFSIHSVFALEVPPLTSPVVDNARIMSQAKRAELENYLLALDKNSSAQIAVLTIPSLQGEGLEEYAIRVAREWGLGQAEDNKGVLLLVALEEKKIRIETGYGAEGDLTDAKCGLIIRNVIAPNFQSGKYAEGITSGVKAIAKTIAPNAEGGGVDIEKKSSGGSSSAVAIIIFFALYFILFTGSLSSKYGAFHWLPWAHFFAGRRHRTRANYYHGGGFGSGGGFRGGGGGFGGGGASGGW